MSRDDKHGEPPTPELAAAEMLVEKLVPKADHMREGIFPMWFGWALRDAFHAGAAFSRSSVGHELAEAEDRYQSAVHGRSEFRKALKMARQEGAGSQADPAAGGEPAAPSASTPSSIGPTIKQLESWQESWENLRREFHRQGNHDGQRGCEFALEAIRRYQMGGWAQSAIAPKYLVSSGGECPQDWLCNDIPEVQAALCEALYGRAEDADADEIDKYLAQVQTMTPSQRDLSYTFEDGWLRIIRFHRADGGNKTP